jgi:hypothetical protein
MYSRNIGNLFLTGRIISVSHVAFGSTRVMATCAHNGQSVGMAAAVCHAHGLLPRDLLEPSRLRELQRRLLASGQYIPHLLLQDPDDQARQSAWRASSQLTLARFPADAAPVPLDTSRAMLLPVAAGPLPAVCFWVDAPQPTTLDVEVRGSSVEGNFTPDVTLYRETIELQPASAQEVWLRPRARVAKPGYFAYCLLQNPALSAHSSNLRVTGVLSLAQSMNRAVAKSARQLPPPDSGIESFEFWLPARRPGGRNLACQIEPPLDLFSPENVRNGVSRPALLPNAWVAAPDDPAPRLTACWPEPRRIGRIELVFDNDFDHPMESVLMGHPERAMPFCVKRYRILDDLGDVRFECPDNHSTRNTVRFDPPLVTSVLHIDVLETHGAPAAILEIRFYES